MTNNEIKCPKCGKSNWVNGEYPLIKKCATPNCTGLYSLDMSNFRDVDGMLIDMDDIPISEIDESEECMEQNF